MPADENRKVRDTVLGLLRGGGAHRHFDAIVDDWPTEARGVRPEGLPYSAWELLEHMRLAQWDIVAFSCNPAHQSPPWPQGYWPKSSGPPDEQAWDKSIKAFRDDLKDMKALVDDTENDLYTPFPWGEGQTLLRQALLVADHNAYHLGQLLTVRRLLNVWPE